MPTRRYANLDPETKIKLLEASIDEFAEKGYNDASLNAIIKAASISKGSLYYYFDDKEDLYVTTLKEGVANLGADLEAILNASPGEDFWASVRELLVKMTSISFRHPKLLALLKGGITLWAKDTSEEGSPIAELFDGVREFTHKWILAGRKVGAVRTDMPEEILVKLIFALGEAMDRWYLLHMDELEPEFLHRIPDLYTDIFRRTAAPAAMLRDPS